MLEDAKTKAQPVGYLGLVHNKDKSFDVTVVSPVGKDRILGYAIAIVHVLTWAMAILFSCIARNHLVDVKYHDVMHDGTIGEVGPSEACKSLALVQIIMVSLSFGLTALFGAFVDKEDTAAPVFGAFLLATVICTVMIASANLTITTIVKDMDTYNFSLAAGVLTGTASSMVVAFYVNFAKGDQGKVNRSPPL